METIVPLEEIQHKYQEWQNQTSPERVREQTHWLLELGVVGTHESVTLQKSAVSPYWTQGYTGHVLDTPRSVSNYLHYLMIGNTPGTDWGQNVTIFF